MAKTPMTEQILCTVTPKLRDRLDQYAEAEEISRAEAVRRGVLLLLGQHDRENNTAIPPELLNDAVGTTEDDFVNGEAYGVH